MDGGSGPCYTVLCIDDDEINQLVVQGMLRAMVHRWGILLSSIDV